MASSGMFYLVALVRTDVSEDLSASFIRVTRIGEKAKRIRELGRTLAINSNCSTLGRKKRQLPVIANVPSSRILFTLMMEAISCHLYNTALITSRTIMS
jgi:hypothetical protein